MTVPDLNRHLCSVLTVELSRTLLPVDCSIRASVTLPVIVTGVMADPCTAVMLTQLAVGGAFTVTEQLTVPVCPVLSLLLPRLILSSEILASAPAGESVPA